MTIRQDRHTHTGSEDHSQDAIAMVQIKSPGGRVDLRKLSGGAELFGPKPPVACRVQLICSPVPLCPYYHPAPHCFCSGHNGLPAVAQTEQTHSQPLDLHVFRSLCLEHFLLHCPMAPSLSSSGLCSKGAPQTDLP